jgi:hypothetical protein
MEIPMALCKPDRAGKSTRHYSGRRLAYLIGRGRGHLNNFLCFPFFLVLFITFLFGER